MIVPFILLVLSLAGIALSVVMPVWRDVALIAGPCAIASLLLLVRGYFHRRARIAEAGRDWMILDGSNVMHWKGGAPDIATVRDVMNHLSALGLTPGVVFDANVGYKVDDRYLSDRDLSRRLGVPRERIMVVPKGRPADPMILDAARDLKAKIVTNDRFRDWEETYPEAREPGRLVRGGYKDGALWLDLERPA